MSEIIFDFESWLKKMLGLTPSVEVEGKKPEPEKIIPVKPATEDIEQSPKPEPTKQYPPYSPMARTKVTEAQPI